MMETFLGEPKPAAQLQMVYLLLSATMLPLSDTTERRSGSNSTERKGESSASQLQSAQ
jgi:hypothetical protein